MQAGDDRRACWQPRSDVWIVDQLKQLSASGQKWAEALGMVSKQCGPGRQHQAVTSQALNHRLFRSRNETSKEGVALREAASARIGANPHQCAVALGKFDG